MVGFRNKFIAHADLDTDIDKVPSFITALAVASGYLRWIPAIAQKHGVYFDRPVDPELFYENIVEESWPVIMSGLAESEAHKEYS